MIKARTLARGLAASAVAATAAAVVMASPASAQPQITGLACDIGRGRVDCIVFPADTVPPYTIRWSVNNVAVPEADDHVTMISTCTPNSITSVRVTITDPTGSVTRKTSRRCGSVIP